MPFDGITIKALARELTADLIDTRIDKIHQPEKDELIFSIRQHRLGTVKLLISANPRWARLHITGDRPVNPSKPPSFCMLLRKYLEGGKIKEIKQIDFERIIHIRIEALDDFREWKEKLLICEFMGRHSNIILVNPENNLIIDAIKKFGSDLNSYREVLPGKTYITPPSQNKLNPLICSYEEFAARMLNQEPNRTLSDSLFNVLSGISPYASKEICRINGLEPEAPIDECGEFELSKTFFGVRAILTDIEHDNNHPVVSFLDSNPVEYSSFLPAIHPPTAIMEYPSMNLACDRYYSAKLTAVRLESMKTNLIRNLRFYLDKAHKKKFLQEGDWAQAHENELYKVWGELITAYSHQLRKGDTETILTDFYTNQEINIKLDPRYTPIQNAQKYFKIYNKSQRAIKHLQGLMARNQEEINYLETVVVEIQQAESPQEISEIIAELAKEGYIKEHAQSKLKPVRSKPRRFISSDGLEIMVGRNNYQNDTLTLKESDRSDLWLHTKDIPGTHVIVRLPRSNKNINEVPDATLEEAAALAAYYSKAGQSDKVPVDYTFRFNVHKPSGAKPGMVIYDNYWTILANPQSAVLDRLVKEKIQNG